MFGGSYPCMTKKGCPKSRNVPTEQFCPAWYEGGMDGHLMEKNPITGETRMVTGCFFQVMPRLLQYTVQFQEQTSAEVSAGRKDTVAAVQAQVATEIREGFHRIVSSIENYETTPPNSATLSLEQIKQ